MEIPKIVKSFQEYLNCPCQYFPPAGDPASVMAAYQKARQRAAKVGRGGLFRPQERFLPMLIAPGETLLEALTWESPEEREANRRKLLSEPVEDGESFFARLIAHRRESYREYGWDWPGEDVTGAMEGGEPIDRFLSITGYEGDTVPLLLAEIPAEHPWEVFARLPFGGWNDCPAGGEQMAAAKYWYERYGAVPAVMTADILEYDLPAPAPRAQAMELALQQYAFCGDIVEQGVGTVGALADSLSQSSKWYFWWD